MSQVVVLLLWLLLPLLLLGVTLDLRVIFPIRVTIFNAVFIPDFHLFPNLIGHHQIYSAVVLAVELLRAPFLWLLRAKVVDLGVPTSSSSSSPTSLTSSLANC